MKAEQNELITRVGPGTPCGALLRRYWQPVALVDEFNPALDPRMAKRPVKAVRVMGQDFVLFRDAQNQWGLLDRDCPHRGADLAYGRLEHGGLLVGGQLEGHQTFARAAPMTSNTCLAIFETRAGSRSPALLTTQAGRIHAMMSVLPW